jgi:hypothetical protein
VKLTLRSLKKRDRSSERGRFGQVFGGRVRASTVVLVVVFVAVGWVYLSYQRASESGGSPTPATQVVPPGFIPDPSYTWVPRARLEQPPVTVTQTEAPPTVTETLTPPSQPPLLPGLPGEPPPGSVPGPPGQPGQPGQPRPPGPGRSPAPPTPGEPSSSAPPPP